MKMLITGGAGFVGSTLCRYFAGKGHEVVALDNLKRRGSERNAASLPAQGVRFVHGDVRNPADLEGLEGNFDALVEASAEPSVLAGIGSSPRYVLDANLQGAINCLEFARTRCGGVLFLSSSRVYSIAPLVGLPLREAESGLVLEAELPGASPAGISEAFPTDSPRSFYGASKLAAELVCQEYAANAGLPVVMNRCGVIAGPGQFGKVDQGVFTLWVARHHFNRPLKYTGFGGTGAQVRDLLHPLDLCELLERQLGRMQDFSGSICNVGGGPEGAVSLRQFTRICQEATGQSVPIASDPATNPVDIPWYVSDCRKITALTGWKPVRRPETIVSDILAWVRENESALADLIQ